MSRSPAGFQSGSDDEWLFFKWITVDIKSFTVGHWKGTAGRLVRFESQRFSQAM